MPTNNAKQFSDDWWEQLEVGLKGVGFAALDALLKQAITAMLGEPADKTESTNLIGGRYQRSTKGIIYKYEHNDGRHVAGIVPRGGVYELWTRSGKELGPFGYPVGLPDLAGNKTTSTFEGGTITSIAEEPRSVMFYNTALIGVDVNGVPQNSIPVLGIPVYSGRGRAPQLKAVIDTVSDSAADVVVLAEMMGNRERTAVKKAVKQKFPHTAEGPDERDPEEDGGLLVLSRHPIREVRSTIYRSCIGEDSFANKGAVMVRVSPTDGPEFCVIGTHLQASPKGQVPEFGVGSGASGKREAQLRHLDSWILAVRDLDLPVIIVGDFNIDANTPGGRETLAENLPDARDLWPEFNMWRRADQKLDDLVTSDKFSTYEPGKQPIPMSSGDRFKKGGRIDLAMLDQGERVTAHVKGMKLVTPELSPGIDASDHYAIKVSFDMSTVSHKLNRKVRKTTAWLKYIHALEVTDGAGVPAASKLDPDEVDVSARIYKGKPGHDDRPRARVEYDLRTMSMGGRHEYSFKPGKTLIFDGADDVHLEITLDEVDTVLGAEVGRTAIGTDRDVIVPKSSQLLHELRGRRYAPNLMTGDGSEYVAILWINVDIEPFTHRRELPSFPDIVV
ncbi:endonuclease/exonuclease/phosphatase family protein [Nocardia sp. NPDC056611]|uniref:endonuclease/exonuclease/phosphatase family protein n=1 Tax=Nocardia sp. NPDC056611 TaxID=3345877 RepID=UPI00366DFFE7